MEKYFFTRHEDCEFKQSEIGQTFCLNCIHFKAINYNEKWIKCERYSVFADIELLKKENEKLKAEILKLKTEVLKSEVEIFDMKGGE